MIWATANSLFDILVNFINFSLFSSKAHVHLIALAPLTLSRIKELFKKILTEIINAILPFTITINNPF